MPKMTVLAMVQSILNDMDSDEVNSINDTIEAYQVAGILEDTFFEIINSRDWPSHEELLQLDATDQTTPTPTHLKIPSASRVKEIKTFKYDVQTSTNTIKQYRDIPYYTPQAFLDSVMSRDDTSSTIDVINDINTSVPLLIKTDSRPNFWTSFDDEYIVCDAYDSAVDNNLQKSKTQCFAILEPSFIKSDLEIPDLPVDSFPYLLAEAKSTAFNALKQTPNSKEEQKSRRQ